MLLRCSENQSGARMSRRGAVAWDQRLDIDASSALEDFPLPSGLTLHPLCIVRKKDEPAISSPLKNLPLTPVERASSSMHDEAASSCKRNEGSKR